MCQRVAARGMRSTEKSTNESMQNAIMAMEALEHEDVHSSSRGNAQLLRRGSA